jgi:hypothetical protein
MKRRRPNDVSSKASLLSLPPELLRIIAMNMYSDDLFRFQASSPEVFAATSDVSFYYNFYKKSIFNNSIETAYYFRERPLNWEHVVKRLYDDKLESARFFYDNEINKVFRPEMYISAITGCEFERLGYELGNIFKSLYIEFQNIRNLIAFDYIQTRISEIREENYELDNNQLWHYFEDILYSDFRYFLHHEDKNIKNMGNVEFWLGTLLFATKNNYTLFEQALVEHIVTSLVKIVAEGSIDCEEAFDHIKRLLPKLLNTENVGYISAYIRNVEPRSLRALSQLYELLFKEVIGKRRYNYSGFFERFVDRLIYNLAQIVVKKDSVQNFLDIIKRCLKWRFFVLDGSWRKLNIYTQRICIVDDRIRDIFYHKGFYLDETFLKDITMTLKQGCSENFRKACERYLYSSEYVSDENKLVIEAKEACRKRAELQTLETIAESLK